MNANLVGGHNDGKPCFCGMCVPDFALLAVDQEVRPTKKQQPMSKEDELAIRHANRLAQHVKEERAEAILN